MMIFHPAMLTLLLATTSVFLLSCAAYAKCGSLDRISVATRLIEVLYPATKGEISFKISGGSTDARNFVTIIGDSKWGRHDEDHKSDHASEDLELPLYFYFDFARGSEVGCRPVEFRRNGFDRKYEATLADINAHPDLSDLRVLDLAKSRGLRFDSNQRATLIKNLPLRPLESISGKLRLKTAVFAVTDDHDHVATHSFARLVWNITAEEVGTTRVLGLFVEPFRGKVVALSEIDRRDLKK